MEVTDQGIGFLGAGKAVLCLLYEALLTDTLALQLAGLVRTNSVDTQAVLVVHAAGETCKDKIYQTSSLASERFTFPSNKLSCRGN